MQDNRWTIRPSFKIPMGTSMKYDGNTLICCKFNIRKIHVVKHLVLHIILFITLCGYLNSQVDHSKAFLCATCG